MEGLGYQSPKAIPCDDLSAGEVGFIFANIKTISDAKIGDTITGRRESAPPSRCPGFKQIKPMVFAGLYPVESHEHGLLRDALEKLRLNDCAFTYEPENSRRWASASAAASWACCIWKSFRSGWSASSPKCGRFSIG